MHSAIVKATKPIDAMPSVHLSQAGELPLAAADAAEETAAAEFAA